MILPDVNVLVYAFRKDAQDHRRYREWLQGVVNGESAYGVPAGRTPHFVAIKIRLRMPETCLSVAPRMRSASPRQ